MAKKIEESKVIEIIKYFTENSITYIEAAKYFNISTSTLSKILKENNIKIDAQRKRRGHKAWNSGLNKKVDLRVAKFAKTISSTASSHRRRSGYLTEYSDVLQKSVKVHNKVWYENTAHWPNGKEGEQIHHIDNDKDNNNFNNLLLTTVSEHSKIHKEYEEVFIKLLRLDILKFNKETRGVDWKSFQELIEKLKV